jgi:hypothetical protein
MQPNHGAALRADQIFHRDTNRPTQARRLRDDLIGGVSRLGAPDFWNRLHLLSRAEQLHADRSSAQPQQLVQIVDNRIPVLSDLIGHSALPPKSRLRQKLPKPPRSLTAAAHSNSRQSPISFI